MTDTPNFLRYQPDKIQVGTVYRYCKSNLDGSFPAIVSIYLASKSHLEVIKREPGSHVLAYVTADMNWDIFSPDHIDSYHMLPNGDLRVQANLVHVIEEHTDYVYVKDINPTVQVDVYPVHDYNFDFISFNLIFRHLVEPEAPFEAGVTMPDFEAFGAGDLKNAMRYGRARIEYAGDETRRERLCRKYHIGGAGLGHQSGWIWVDKQHEYWVDYEHPVPDNPTWNSFKFALLSVEMMTAGEWNHDMAAELERAQTYVG